MIRNISTGLVERFVYAVLLLLWMSVHILLNVQDLGLKGSFGIMYLWVFLFPALIFFSQLVFKSWFGWLISVALFFVFFLYIVVTVSTELFASPAVRIVSYHLEDYLSLLITVGIVGGVGYILKRIRPCWNS